MAVAVDSVGALNRLAVRVACVLGCVASAAELSVVPSGASARATCDVVSSDSRGMAVAVSSARAHDGLAVGVSSVLVCLAAVTGSALVARRAGAGAATDVVPSNLRGVSTAVLGNGALNWGAAWVVLVGRLEARVAGLSGVS